MEGTRTLILLEEILTGKIQDSDEFKKKTKDLHFLLSKSSLPLLKAATIISKILKDKKILCNENYEIFTNYIETAISGNKNLDLPLKNTGFSDKIAQKTCKLIFGVDCLQKIIKNALQLIFNSLKNKGLRKNKEKQACINLAYLIQCIFIKTKAESLGILKKWSENRKKKRILGKFKEKLTKFNIIKKILKTIPPTFESLAFYR